MAELPNSKGTFQVSDPKDFDSLNIRAFGPPVGDLLDKIFGPDFGTYYRRLKGDDSEIFRREIAEAHGEDMVDDMISEMETYAYLFPDLIEEMEAEDAKPKAPSSLERREDNGDSSDMAFFDKVFGPDFGTYYRRLKSADGELFRREIADAYGEDMVDDFVVEMESHAAMFPTLVENAGEADRGQP